MCTLADIINSIGCATEPTEVNTLKISDLLINPNPSAQKAGAIPRESQSVEKKAAEAPAVSSESGRILEELKSQGYTVSSEEADRIAEFIETTEGTEAEKLQTVKTALEKGIPLSARSLKSIRAALFNQVLPPELRQALADSGVPREQAALLRFIQALAAKEEHINTGLKIGEAEAASDAPAVIQTDAGGRISQPTQGDDEMAAWVMKALDQLAHLSAALESSAGLLQGADTEPTAAQASTAPGERSPAGETAPASFSADGSPSAKEEEIRPEASAELQQAAGLLLSAMEGWDGASYPLSQEAAAQGIALLMKEVTPRMAVVKEVFEVLRKTVTAELTAVSGQLAEPSPLNKAQAEEKLSQVIEKLDKAILKSDIPLFTSMTAEKQLLKWSSELQRARGLVVQGEGTQAAEIVDRVSKGLQALEFQPARLKVIHRTLQQTVSGGGVPEKGLQQRAQQQVNRILEPAQTPRQVLEAFKALGLTHESEVVSALGQSQRKLKEDWLPEENLKSLLMKLAADTDEKLTTVTGAEKAMNNLTGQQLLSRPEAKLQGQTLFFSIPMEMANRVEDLKIYVQSRKDKGKVDWENCTFYFAVHTEKYGDVGIRFAAVRKSVSIQVKCDNQTLRDAVNPLIEDFKETMWETGYKIAGVSYSPLKEGEAAAKAEEPVASDAEGKGLNLKV